MDPTLERRLLAATHGQLVFLVQEMVAQHPALLQEVVDKLEVRTPNAEQESGAVRQLPGDWSELSVAEVPLSLGGEPLLLPIHLERFRQRLEEYPLRLQQGESAATISEDLRNVLQEAGLRVQHCDYHGALALYSLVLDKLLAEGDETLLAIFHQEVAQTLPTLESLLSTASSNIVADVSHTFAPLLEPALRHLWLERLFAFWLQRMQRQRVDNDLPEILLATAWSDDLPFLHNLVLDELQRHRVGGSSNIVDLSHQFRTRALERFLRELSAL